MKRWMIRVGKWCFLGLSVAVVACGAHQTVPPDPPLEPVAESSSKPAPAPLPNVVMKRAFVGPDGLRIEVLELEGDQALIEVEGVQSELRGLVLRYEKENDGHALRYRTPWHGRKLNTLVKLEGPGTWKAYVPDATRDGFVLTFSEETSGQINEQAMIDAHNAQLADGTIERFGAFDRDAEESQERESIAKDLARTSKECEHSFEFRVNWQTVSQEQILTKSVASYCGSLLSGMRNICRNESGKHFLKNHVKAAECRLDGDHELALNEGTISWAIGFQTYNLDQKATEALLAMSANGTTTLGAEILAEQTTVCTDPSGKYMVMMGPEGAHHRGMAYGADKKLSYVPRPKLLGEGWFLDPRQRNEKLNENFRGYDLRVYSVVEADRENGTCTLSCGARKVELSLLQGAQKQEAMRGVEFRASPHTREPYALARDGLGTYYYVDRGNTPETARDFRLYRGKRGVVKPLGMKDVVSDSEGEIFASDSGKLRLVLADKSSPGATPRQAQWIANGTSHKLVTLPLVDNYQLIYNELGVYLGQPLGTPCDDL